MENLLGYSLERMTDCFLARGQSKFRAKQVFGWIYGKGVLDFDKMTDVSLSFREELKRDFCLSLPSIIAKQVASDGTVKLLLQLEDGAKVEEVMMPYDYGCPICVSSEVGCSMGCAFCASGLLKKERGLTSAEMVGQLLVMNQVLSEYGLRVTHINVMGTGEPFDNYDNVMEFIRIANCQTGLAIGARHITVSTCGLPEGIRRYGKEGLQTNLALSLHAPNDKIRNKIMPVSLKYPMKDLIAAIKDYLSTSGRRVTFEYILLSGVNDSLECADELAHLIRDNDLFAYVNLIPYNEVKEMKWKRSSKTSVAAFHNALLKKGINATVRKEFGGDIDAACGQLRVKYEKQR